MTRVVLAAALVAALAPGVATADPPVNLKLRHAPTPRHLRMRPRTAATPATDPTTPSAPAPPNANANAKEKTKAKVKSTGKPGRARPGDRARRRLRPQGRPPRRRAGRVPARSRVRRRWRRDQRAAIARRRAAGRRGDYREVRAHGFGNLFVGTRGLLIPPLSNYLSVGFRLAPDLSSVAPLADALRQHARRPDPRRRGRRRRTSCPASGCARCACAPAGSTRTGRGRSTSTAACSRGPASRSRSARWSECGSTTSRRRASRRACRRSPR